ncbi:unnamed protein product [Meloidogyne enterolobii]|uniref:Uncharacterized protein n=1 Tax=Meloidogyne enterolobii TaxID=390850 RepID=A0ACB0XL32_MELEN
MYINFFDFFNSLYEKNTDSQSCPLLFLPFFILYHSSFSPHFPLFFPQKHSPPPPPKYSTCTHIKTSFL